MLRGAGGAVAVAIAAILVCCSADPHQEQDAHNEHSSADRFDASGHKTRNLDPLAGKRLTRDVRDTHNSVRAGEAGASGYSEHKRNFDEIDRSDLNPFALKRNFDEIDLTSLPFPNGIKRFYSVYSTNYLDSPLEAWRSGNKKRIRTPDYPMDEIDLSNFPIGSKRDASNRFNKKLGPDYPFDEIDGLYFPIGSRRAFNREAWWSGNKKRLRTPDYPMDEIDLSNFPIGSKRDPSNRFNKKLGPDYPFDEIDGSYFPIGTFNREAWWSGNKKRLRTPDYPMDEIDLSNFPIGSKRVPSNRFNKKLGPDYPFDEIDGSYFPIGSRRAFSQ